MIVQKKPEEKIVKIEWEYLDIDKLTTDDIEEICEMVERILFEYGFSKREAEALVNAVYKVGWLDGYENT